MPSSVHTTFKEGVYSAASDHDDACYDAQK
jgi:hypothetical protein